MKTRQSYSSTDPGGWQCNKEYNTGSAALSQLSLSVNMDMTWFLLFKVGLVGYTPETPSFCMSSLKSNKGTRNRIVKFKVNYEVLRKGRCKGHTLF